MRRSLARYYDCLDMNYCHDSKSCIRCKKVSSYYINMRNTNSPWDPQDAKIIHDLCRPNKDENPKVMGIISYLHVSFLRECISYEEYGHDLRLCTPEGCVAVMKGQRFCYLRETTLEEKVAIIKKLLSDPYSPLFSDSSRRVGKKVPQKSPPKYRGYKKVVKRRSMTNGVRDVKPKRTIKGRIIRRKNESGAQKVKTLHKTIDPSSISPKDKEPGKGTLKRKRWLLDKLKNNNGHEDNMFDDPFSNMNYYPIQNVADDDDDSDLSNIQNMATPRRSFSISSREEDESPPSEVCLSPEEFRVSRKEAEEFQYHRSKRRKILAFDDKSKIKIKSESPDTTKVLEEACEILRQQPKGEKDSGSESDDSYFTGPSDNES